MSIGDGGLNLPYEDDPAFGTPGELSFDLTENTMATGLVVLATALREHEIPGLRVPHPTITFRFAKPNGEFFPQITLIVSEDELNQLKRTVSHAIDGAFRGAAKARKRQQ